MVTDRDVVVDALRAGGEHDLALKAACALPRRVDTEKDAAVLTMLGVSADVLDGCAEPPGRD